MVMIMVYPVFSYSTDFNIDMIKSDNKENINNEQFSNELYIKPGEYSFDLFINNKRIKSYNIYYIETNKKTIYECIPFEIKKYFNLKEQEDQKIKSKMVLYNDKIECIDEKSLIGLNIKTESNINLARFNISIPEIYQKQMYDNWTPTEFWDDGINAMFFDYRLTFEYRKNNDNNKSKEISAYGVTGINLGAWRIRANYDANINNENSYTDEKKITVRDIHAFRPIRKISSILYAGELSPQSLIFESVRLLGVNIQDDERMLPPQLRGYSPTISGIAQSNAKVSIWHLGRIIYQTTVPPGPFTINDLDSGLQGRILVTIKEEDGKETQFEQNLESLPYLSRKNSLRYNLSLGKPLKNNHNTRNINIIMGDLSYGLASNTSLIGGSVLSKNYQSYNIGLAQGLGDFGALSADITHSEAKFYNGKSSSGNSYRVNYSKDIEKTYSSITFSNYRYSDKGYLDLSQYMDIYDAYNGDFHETKNHNFNDIFRKKKSLYMINFNQKIFPDNRDLTFNSSISYSKQSYWDDSNASQRLSLMISKNWIINKAPLYASLNISKVNNSHFSDKIVSFNINIPLGSNNVNYSFSKNDNGIENNISYYKTFDDNSYMNASVYGDNDNRRGIRGMYSKQYPSNDIDIFGSVGNGNTSASINVSGGITVTQFGMAMHPKINSDSRIMIDTNGVNNVPFESTNTRTNIKGIAVIDGNSYSKKETKIDFNKLDDNVEIFDSIKDITLTEGAVGYLNFDSLYGEKRMATIKMEDNTYPPYASIVFNSKNRQVGMVGKDGLTYLAGLKENEQFHIEWNGKIQCIFHPSNLNSKLSALTFYCRR